MVGMSREEWLIGSCDSRGDKGKTMRLVNLEMGRCHKSGVGTLVGGRGYGVWGKRDGWHIHM